MIDKDPGLALAAIVETASALILPLWRKGVTVETKADESPVTEADRRGEALIVEALARDFPGLAVVAEEEVACSGAPLEVGECFFLVDPLDGTKAFIRGDAHFTVNIALIENGAPIAGAIAAPATGETWFTLGGAARKRRFGETEGEPIHVRKADPAHLVALGSHTAKPDAVAELKTRYGFTDMIAMDSSIKLCRIAEGAADIYPRHGTTMEWDIAAGHAVLAAAGGRLTTPDGAAFFYGKAADGFTNSWFVARGA
ncbi:MAG TPA: 3'(2'),5'-bisphosphate nucleotidase CysQ [Caulobacteraceae bacterium]|nr:3'(2'),5'-bisphosphate nucleotidase CysQ [Caulobacteraceae bacterium]